MKHRITTYPFDRLIVAYSILIIAVVLIFGRPIGHYIDELVFYAGLIIMVSIIVRYFDETRGWAPAFVRLIYPLVMFTFLYRMTGGMMHVLFPEFFDWQITAFEKTVLGVNPTIYIDRHLLHPIPNEIFSAAYLSYYFMLPGFVLPVFFLKNYAVVKRTVTALCLTFFMSYILFFAYPIEGPRWFFASEYIHKIEGPIFRPLVEFVIAKGAVRGGAMPSSHVAVALVILLSAFRYYRKAGWVLLPFNIGLMIGTFWGRFHYVSDVAVGILFGSAATLMTWKYYDRWAEPATVSDVERQQEIEHAA